MKTLLERLENILEEGLGNLADIPKPWIKKLTNISLGGENSQITNGPSFKITKSRSKELSSAITDKPAGTIGVYIKVNDKPFALIDIETYETSNKKYNMIAPDGTTKTVPDFRYPTAMQRRRGNYSLFKFDRQNLSLSELCDLLPSDETLQVVYISVDKNRVDIRNKRAEIKKGLGNKYTDQKDSRKRKVTPSSEDIEDVKKEALVKYIKDKVGPALDRLKSVLDLKRSKIDDILSIDTDSSIDSAFKGTLKSGMGVDSREFQQVLNDYSKAALGFNSLLNKINSVIKEGKIKKNDSYNASSPVFKNTWDYEYLKKEIEEIVQGRN